MPIIFPFIYLATLYLNSNQLLNDPHNCDRFRMTTSQQHRTIVGSLFILVAVYLVFGMFGDPFESAPIWQNILYCVFAATYLLAGVSQIKDKRWSLWVSLPISLVSIIVFPIGTTLTAYFLWALIKLEKDRENRNNRLLRKLGQLTLIDFMILTFLCFLIPYGGIARDTIGGLKFLATSIAVFICCIGVISKIIHKSKFAWVYVVLAILPTSIFFLGNFDMGYGP